GDDRAAARDFVADEFGGDVVGDRGAPVLPVALVFGEAGAAEVLALGDVFHLGRDDAAAGVVHLADVAAGFGAERAAQRGGERRDAARAVGAELAVVFGAHLAGRVFLDVAARELPFAAQGREAGGDVDRGGGVGVGA